MTVTGVPSVLVIGGHDPSGAGIQADIETCAAFGGHAACVVTAITAQNTRTVTRVDPVAPDLIIDQMQCLLEECRFAACKTGLIPNVETLRAVCGLLSECAIPIVVDPILAAGSGPRLTRDGLAEALLSELLPGALVCTPNLSEGRELTGRTDIDDVGSCLSRTGCEYVLLTGADEPTTDVDNYLYHRGERIMVFTWPRLPYRYHGSGCTLAASIAACLSRGMNVIGAIKEGQSFTWRCLSEAVDFGGAQRIPSRRNDDDSRDSV